MARIILLKETDWQAIQRTLPHALASCGHFTLLAYPAWCAIKLHREETWEFLKGDPRIINLGRRGDRGVARLAPAVVQKLGAIAANAATVNDVLDDLTGFSNLFD